MHRLGLLDQAFYKMETCGMSPQYMAGAMILDVTDSPHPVDAQALVDHIAASMEEVPLMRQKLVQDPLKLGDIRLVDDPDFDVRNHVTMTTLEAPGGYRELTECLGVFSANRMDLSRPLWHFEVIDGLEGGRLAVAMHLHHSILDGEGAGHALQGIWSDRPIAARKPRQESWKSNSQPTPFKLLRSALMENAERLYVKTPSFLLKNTAPLLRLISAEIGKKFVSNGEASGRSLPPVQFTSLNVPRLSEKRAVAYAELPLEEVKQLRRYYDCSINDLALVMNSFALQHYFDELGETVDFDLVAGMPMSLRSEGDDSIGNQVAISRVNLYNASLQGIDQQLAAINRDTSEIKSQANRNRGGSVEEAKEKAIAVDYTELSTLFSPILLEGVLYGALKFDLLQKNPWVNVAITNVPGSPGEQFMAGARLVTSVPMAPCVDVVGLTVTVTSTAGNLLLGFHGCGEGIKDKELFVEGVELAFAELKRLAAPTKRKARPKNRARAQKKT